MVEGMIWIPLDGKLSLIYIGARTFAQQRLRSGFYSVLPALRISRFKIHQLDYRSIFSRIVCVSSFIDRTGQSSRVYEKSKNEGSPAIGAKDLGEIRAKGSGCVPKSGASSIRARTTGKNTKEHYRRCARTTKDD